MNIAREHTLKLINDKPISMDAIHESRYKFEEQLGWPPDTLVMSMDAWETLRLETRPEWPNFDTIFGMKAWVNGDIKPGVWYVERSEEIVEAVK